MATIKINTATKVTPQCYAYTTPGIPAHDGWTKIGFTERDVETRVKEQSHTADIKCKICWHYKAAFITEPFETFTDKNFHSYLNKLGVKQKKGTEWFYISPEEAEKDFFKFIRNHGHFSSGDHASVVPYTLRKEQNQAVEQTLKYFKSHPKGEFLWNAKPRFGKTLSAYDLCKRLNAHNILIVTNRPAIANSWYSDYETFLGPQSGYLFVSNVDGLKGKQYVLRNDKDHAEFQRRAWEDESVKGRIEFVSLQDLKGSIYFGGIHEKLKEVKELNWDILIIDEAHEGVDTYKTDTAFNHINRKWTLHLSGTPFKALANDKFPEEAIFNWTYADEQKMKREWDDSSELENPYANLPQLNLFTYQMSDIVRDKLKHGIELADNDVEEYAFDLSEFFATNESGKFVHEKDVDKFLDALTCQDKFPFSTPELRDKLKHTFWLLNRVASAKELARKLKLHPFFKDYEIVLAAGDGKLDDDEETEKAFNHVTKAIKEHDKTITLSVGQLTTGVTIPEWSAVLMLSNMASPSLYMQAAFRAQNPCLFTDNKGNSYRKKNAYVFDFDPARTLKIFDQFANDLIPETFGETKELEQRKRNVRELLNFFPVYGEDDSGSMVELDAESVLIIPRHIHAREVVERGFMSNFLFANISGIFGAPKEIIDLISSMQAIEEPKKLSPVDVDENTRNKLALNDEGEVEIPREKTIGLAGDLFGDKVYSSIEDKLVATVKDISTKYTSTPSKDQLSELKKQFSKPIADTLIETANQHYGKEWKIATKRQVENKIREMTDKIVNREYGDYSIQENKLSKEKDEKIKEAQHQGASMNDITKLEEEYKQKSNQNFKALVEKIHQNIKSEDAIEQAAESIVETAETAKLRNTRDSIENQVRDHLRGFARTIPSFLMAYGDEDTTLSNFDSLVPEDVFWEVTVNPQNGQGVSLEQFRMLRDGGYYFEKDENGIEIRDEEHKKHFAGHLFDEVVFDDAVKEFLKKRTELADYFKGTDKEDIFDYIPPQRTNQIFTPKRVVKDMVDQLEKENPGCFDNPDNTFADLYMKSGMYITEIVTRLYQSEKMKELFPDDGERLNHIFAKQVYGCAPTEIIYRICLRYILGFSNEIHIDKYNIECCDTLKYAKEGNLRQKLENIFAL